MLLQEITICAAVCAVSKALNDAHGKGVRNISFLAYSKTDKGVP